MNQDIERKANEIGFSSDTMSHVFGVKTGPTFYEGLVDCNSEIEFED